jgi:hypothetical protein
MNEKRWNDVEWQPERIAERDAMTVVLLVDCDEDGRMRMHSAGTFKDAGEAALFAIGVEVG